MSECHRHTERCDTEICSVCNCCGKCPVDCSCPGCTQCGCADYGGGQ